MFFLGISTSWVGWQVVIGGALLALPGEILRGWVMGGDNMDHRNLVHTLAIGLRMKISARPAAVVWVPTNVFDLV